MADPIEWSVTLGPPTGDQQPAFLHGYVDGRVKFEGVYVFEIEGVDPDNIETAATSLKWVLQRELFDMDQVARLEHLVQPLPGHFSGRLIDLRVSPARPTALEHILEDET